MNSLVDLLGEDYNEEKGNHNREKNTYYIEKITEFENGTFKNSSYDELLDISKDNPEECNKICRNLNTIRDGIAQLLGFRDINLCFENKSDMDFFVWLISKKRYGVAIPTGELFIIDVYTTNYENSKHYFLPLPACSSERDRYTIITTTEGSNILQISYE